MQQLASGVEALHRARASDVETTAQVQATLQRTLSASSSIEMRLEQTAEEQKKAKAAAEVLYTPIRRCEFGTKYR